MTTDGDALPVTALIAASAEQPIIIFDGNAALCMAVVDRMSAGQLDESWECAGVYLLLDRHSDEGYSAYVGRAGAGLRNRIRQHLRKRDHWDRALLVARDTTHGWHSAQIGWLEGRLHELLEGAEQATLRNDVRPQDDTLPPYERLALEAAITPIAAVLRLLGYSPDAVDEDTTSTSLSPAEKAWVTRRAYDVSLADLFAASLIEEGDRLISTNGAWPATAVIGPDGSILLEGKSFISPSGAGKVAKRGKAANGWSFWAVDKADGSRTQLSTLRARYIRARTSSEAALGPAASEPDA